MAAQNKFSTAHEDRSGVTEAIRQGANDLRHQAESIGHNVREAGKEKIAEVRQSIQETGSHLQETVGETAEQLRATAHEYYRAGRDQMCQFEKSLESRIREKPVTALCIAAGLGLLVGMVWARR